MHTATKYIEVDTAHRVMTHGSKCRKLHGHRYKIEMTVEAIELVAKGEQSGMVIDFGFMKELMMDKIHYFMDHGTILSKNDPLVTILLGGIEPTGVPNGTPVLFDRELVKLYIVDFIPTAENIAEHFYYVLLPGVCSLSNGKARLHSVTVYETGSCYATYNPR